MSGDRLYARYLADVSSRLEIYGLDGGLVDAIGLPGLGTASGVSAARHWRSGLLLILELHDPG